jgi:hypothetical protein
MTEFQRSRARDMTAAESIEMADLKCIDRTGYLPPPSRFR